MKQLETHPVFNSAIKVSDAPQKEKKMPPVKEDKEDLGFKLFEQAEKDPPPEKGSNKHCQIQVLLIYQVDWCFLVELSNGIIYRHNR